MKKPKRVFAKQNILSKTSQKSQKKNGPMD